MVSYEVIFFIVNIIAELANANNSTVIDYFTDFYCEIPQNEIKIL